MNKLHIGFTTTIEPPKSGCLFIDDTPAHFPRARIFDPAIHSLNPLKDITYKKARELTEALYTITPHGENTLTVRDGKRALLKAILKADRLDRIEGDEEVDAMVADILVSPVLKRVLCNPTNFSFKPRSVIMAKLDRTQLGDFDALVLGLLLINHFKGQVVVPDFGFYGRDAHISLIRERRLIAGVNFIDELPLRLRHAALLIEEKVPSATTLNDAETLAKYAGFIPGTNGFNDFVQHAILPHYFR